MKQDQKNRAAVQPQTWCEDCRVRIAPYEDFVTHNKRMLHRQCFQKAKQRAVAPILTVADLGSAIKSF